MGKASESYLWKTLNNNLKLRNKASEIKPAQRGKRIPLTFGQERLWLAEQSESGVPLHNMCDIFRLKVLWIKTLLKQVWKKSLKGMKF